MGHYEVHGMTLIKQNKTMSCWYASAQMVIQWRQDQDQQSTASLIPPDLDAECIKLRDSNNGIANPQILNMAKRLGLVAIPPMSPSADGLETWLKSYGPLWVNGKSHIVVIAGIDTRTNTVLVYDPDPATATAWRSLTSWYAFGSSVSTRDTGSDVQAVFLYAPQQ